MSLPLTTPPIILDPTNLPRPSYNMKSEAGPFKVGSGSWLLPEDQPYSSAPLHSQLSVYEQIPGISPWSEDDGANRPPFGNDSAWVYDPATDKIYIMGTNAGGGASTLYTFNCATKLYEPPSPNTGFEGEGFGVQYRNCVKLSNGDVLHIYQGTTGTGNIYYNRFSSGAWGGQVLLLTTGLGNAATKVKARCDAADRVHIQFIFQSGSGAAPSELYYVQIDGITGAVGAMVSVYTFDDFGINSPNLSTGNIAISDANDTVYLIAAPYNGHFLPGMAYGSPLSAPVWNTSRPSSGVEIDTAVQPLDMPLCLSFDDSGNLVAFWGIAGGVDGITGGFTRVLIWSSIWYFDIGIGRFMWHDSFGNPAAIELFYSLWGQGAPFDNPPPSVTYTDGLFLPILHISVLKIPGDWILVGGYEQTSGAFNDFTFIIATPGASGKRRTFAHTKPGHSRTSHF